MRCCPPQASFGASLVGICLLQLLVSIVLVWYVGYRSTQSLISALSEQLRDAALESLCVDLHTTLVSPMRAVLALSSMMSMTVPDLANTITLQNRSGVLAAISLIPLLFPEASSAGCSTRNGELVAMINISATTTLLSTDLPFKDGIMYALQDGSSNFTVDFKVPMNPADRSALNPLPDFNLSQTSADLGDTNYSLYPYHPELSAQFLAGAAAQGNYAWSSIFPLSVRGDYSAVSATKATLTSDGQVGYVCYSSIYLNRLGDLLQALKPVYGEQGLSVVLDARSGQLLAVSDDSLSQLVGEVLYDDSSDPLLSLLASVLIAKGLLVSSLYPTVVFPNASSFPADFIQESTKFTSFPAFSAVPVSLYGDAYHVQATVLSSTGQTWVVVIVSKDSDFDGDVERQQLLVGLISMAVLVASIVAMLLFTRCLTRPLRRMVTYMTEVTDVDASLAPVQQVQTTVPRSEQLNDILLRWRTMKSRENEQHRCGGFGICPRSSVSRLNGPPLITELAELHCSFESMLNQLVLTAKQAEEAVDAKRQFIRYVFHEVRVPLNAITLGLAQLKAMADNGAEEQEGEQLKERGEIVNLVHGQTLVVGHILNDVLSLHKIEDGGFTLQYAPFSLESLVLATMKSFLPSVHDKQLSFTLNLVDLSVWLFSGTSTQPQKLPRVDVVGDKYRLRQVLANLLSNAIKFTPPSHSITVSVEVKKVTQSLVGSRRGSKRLSGVGQPVAVQLMTNDQVDGMDLCLPAGVAHEGVIVITVRDSGVGISEEGRRKLFMPYMQVLPGELQQGGGTGLGLSISQSLMKLHGGCLEYRSNEPDTGSSFCMTVPMRMQLRPPELKLSAEQHSKGIALFGPAEDRETENSAFLEIEAQRRPESAAVQLRLSQSGSSEMLSLLPRQSLLTPRIRAISSPADACISASMFSPSSPPTSASDFASVLPNIQRSAASHLTSSSSRSRSLTASNEDRLRVLVAEDSLPNLKLLLMTLRRMGAVAHGVENGQQCIDEFAHGSQYDMVFMDGNMPVLSGLEATRRLRAMGLSLPIYALTGNAMTEDQQEFLDAGATPPVLTKPIHQHVLQRLLSDAKQQKDKVKRKPHVLPQTS